MLGTELLFTVVTLHLSNTKTFKTCLSAVTSVKSRTQDGNDVIDILFLIEVNPYIQDCGDCIDQQQHLKCSIEECVDAHSGAGDRELSVLGRRRHAAQSCCDRSPSQVLQSSRSMSGFSRAVLVCLRALCRQQTRCLQQGGIPHLS